MAATVLVFTFCLTIMFVDALLAHAQDARTTHIRYVVVLSLAISG